MKKIKLVLYGEPGVGKSVFASHSIKPFFICTDGNYEWLEDFGAKHEDHVQVSSWKQAKEVFSQNFDGYETVVVDLTEDLFKWCEYEYCKRNRIDHVSDIGFGKAYDATRNEFFVEISKLLSKDKHVILIMHGSTMIFKDRRGVEQTRYLPTDRIPSKVIDMIEGRVRYFLRAYLSVEEVNGKLIKRRYLSLIPKENEFGISRGLDESSVPHDIDLNFDEFMSAIGLTNASNTTEQIDERIQLSIDDVVSKQTVQATVEVKPVNDIQIKNDEKSNDDAKSFEEVKIEDGFKKRQELLAMIKNKNKHQ